MIFGGRTFYPSQHLVEVENILKVDATLIIPTSKPPVHPPNHSPQSRERTYHIRIPLQIQQIQQRIRMILHTGRGHTLRTGDVGVIPIHKDAGLGDVLGQVIAGPEGAVGVGPCLVGVVDATAGVEAVDEDEAAPG